MVDQSWVPGLLFGPLQLRRETASRGLSFIEEKTSHVIVTGSHVTLEGWGVPPSPPHPFGTPHSTHVTFCKGIKAREPWRGTCPQTLSADVSVLVLLCVYLLTIFKNGGPQDESSGWWVANPRQSH